MLRFTQKFKKNIAKKQSILGPRNYATDPKKSDIYSKENDPMSKYSEAEVADIKKRINRNTNRMYTVLYGMAGGALGAIGISLYLFGNPK
jgi:hypothetical protein